MDKIKAFFDSVEGKKITVVGIGVSNTPLIKMLAKKGARVTACDKMSTEALGTVTDELEGLGVRLSLGEGYLDKINADIVIKTPGMRFDVPALLQAEKKGAKITSEMEIFFELCPCKIIAVTGSDGKSTTTTLISQLLREAGYTVHLGGNIGTPLLPKIEEIAKGDIAVVELSSFQLHTMKKSPDIAVITNITPNHLDMHKSMEEYIEAKKNIFLYQKSGDLLVLSYDNEITNSFIEKATANVLTFSSIDRTCDFFLDGDDAIYENDNEINKKLVSKEDVLLPGRHNKENYMAAYAAVRDLIKPSVLIKVAREFKGISHRLELCANKNDVRYYNDSIATSPTRTIACINSFDKPIVVIAGGYDKKIAFDTLAPYIIQKVKLLILVGATSQKIRSAVENAQGYKKGAPKIIMCASMSEAVETAHREAVAGDNVVLSPACASFDMYKNFEVRGNHFKTLVQAIQ